VECRDVQNLLHPFVDGELDLVRHLQIEHHLADCTGCADRERGLRQLREALAAPELRYRAPDALRARLRSAAAPPAPRKRRTTRALVATAAGVVLLVAASLAAGALLVRPSAEDRLAEEVVAGHVRALQVAHATDVASSDRHTVKPWFRGKVDFAPQVPDLAGSGFVLTGGRLDYLGNRPVAAVVYHRRAHLINVFTWPAGGGEVDRLVRALYRQGFHVRVWQRAGMAYWVISDLNPEELDEFVQLFQAHAITPPR
jgi:anti-sigma factor RsiW